MILGLKFEDWDGYDIPFAILFIYNIKGSDE